MVFTALHAGVVNSFAVPQAVEFVETEFNDVVILHLSCTNTHTAFALDRVEATLSNDVATIASFASCTLPATLTVVPGATASASSSSARRPGSVAFGPVDATVPEQSSVLSGAGGNDTTVTAFVVVAVPSAAVGSDVCVVTSTIALPPTAVAPFSVVYSDSVVAVAAASTLGLVSSQVLVNMQVNLRRRHCA